MIFLIWFFYQIREDDDKEGDAEDDEREETMDIDDHKEQGPNSKESRRNATIHASNVNILIFSHNLFFKSLFQKII